MTSKGEELPFDQFADFIRGWAGLSSKKIIVPGTKFEEDLGITGDDGLEILEATEKKYGFRCPP